jgi:hypothetical protein
MTACVALGSSASRSSSRLANVGHIMARSMLSSSMRTMRSSGLKKAGTERMYLGGGDSSMSPSLASVFDEGFFSLNSSSCAPGGATTLNVGFGMYSLILLFSAILVRPSTSTYLTTCL